MDYLISIFRLQIMSKVSFRARALDVSKPMPIYRSEEIPDLRDFDKINRAVLQMPTGMEKEEETVRLGCSKSLCCAAILNFGARYRRNFRKQFARKSSKRAACLVRRIMHIKHFAWYLRILHVCESGCRPSCG